MVLRDMTIFSNKEGNPLLKMHGQRQKLKHRFDVIHKLGQGTYGKVQLAVDKDSGQQVAIKTIRKSKIETEQDLIRIRREIQIMSSVQHPHIIHIYEVFENKEKIVLVMQYASGGELYDYLNEKKVLSEVDARRLFRQIASAVYYCHKNKICHRDLKLENIFLDEKGNAKIGDFGLSNVYDNRHFLTTFCGSPLYASPEIVQGTPYYGPEVDCWSMGVLLYTLVYGAMPFDGSNFKRLVKQISEGDYYEPKKKSEASGLIREILTVSPSKRANIVDICSHWWINQGCDHMLTDISEDLANLTPVRIDFLLALAPPVTPTDESPNDGETSQQNGVVASATEPVKLPKGESKAEDNAGEGKSSSSVEIANLNKRRSLSVPDLAARAMDLFVKSSQQNDDDEDKSSHQKRSENDSRSIVSPNDGRKKKPRMGVSALVNDSVPVESDVPSISEVEKTSTESGNDGSTAEINPPKSIEEKEISETKNSSQSEMDVSEEIKMIEESVPKPLPVPLFKEIIEDKTEEPSATSSVKKEEEKAKEEIRTKKSTSPVKKTTKTTKPNVIKKVKKKTEDSAAKDGSVKSKERSPTSKMSKEEPTAKNSKPREDRIVKRPKKIKIPTPMQAAEALIMENKKSSTPNKLTDVKKNFESPKATPKPKVLIPSYKVSDAKKAFETSDKKPSPPPIKETRRRSSVTSPLIKKFSSQKANEDSAKKESSPSNKAVKSVKPKITKSKISSKPSSPEKVLKIVETSSQESVTFNDKNIEEAEEKVASTKITIQSAKETSEENDDSQESPAVETEPELFIREEGDPPEMPVLDSNKNDDSSQCSEDQHTDSDSRDTPERKGSSSQNIDMDLKMSAKDILKRNIARAKLSERRSSQQNSVSENQQCPETPPTAENTSPPISKSMYKIPTPYSRDEDEQKVSKAEIELKNEGASCKITDDHSNESGPAPEMENRQSIRVDSTSGEANNVDPLASSDQSGGHAISKSFRKFTFTKDGKCIEETGQIFKNDPEGKWTTIKTTTVKTNSNSMPDFDDLKSSFDRHENLTDDFKEPRIERSDSTSSSGPDDIFEDFFESFSGDSVFFNLKRMNSLVKKHFGRHHPLFEKHRGYKKMGSRRRSSSHNRRPSTATDQDSQTEDNDTDVDLDSPFSATGSQNIQNLLKKFNKNSVDDFLQNRFSTIGRQSRRTSTSSKYSTRDAEPSRRESLFDSFASSGRRPGSAFARSMSNDRQDSQSPSVHSSSFKNIRSQFGMNSKNVGNCETPTEYTSSVPGYSRQSSQYSSSKTADGIERIFADVGRVNLDRGWQSSHFPDFSRQSSQSTDSTRGGYSSPSHDVGHSNSRFGDVPDYSHKTYSISTGHPPHVITRRFTKTSTSESNPQTPTASGSNPLSFNAPLRFSQEHIPRRGSVSSTVYSRQTSNESVPQGQAPDSGFRATIKLSRSGFEPPDVQHSVYGTMQPQIRIRYTRSDSSGVPKSSSQSLGQTNKPPTSSKCEDGVHCGTPDREVDSANYAKCSDGEHCGTPPPSQQNVAQSETTTRPVDDKNYSKNDGNEFETKESNKVDEGSTFDARPSESIDFDEGSNGGVESSSSTMSLLESLKTLGYADVMKSRQSQEDLRSARLVADARAKRLAGQSIYGRGATDGICKQTSDHSIFSANVGSNGLLSPDVLLKERAKSEEACSRPGKDANNIEPLDRWNEGDVATRSGSEEPVRSKLCRDESVSSTDSMDRYTDDGGCSVDLSSEKHEDSVSERIRRKSYFSRFNDDRPRRAKKPLAMTTSDPRRHSGYSFSSFDEACGHSQAPSNARRTSYSMAHESSFDSDPGVGISSPSPSLERCSSSNSPIRSSFLRNNDEWFQDFEARASQMLDEMYEHDARMLQSLPLRHRSRRSAGSLFSGSDKKSRRPKHIDDFQPSNGYLSNLHKPRAEDPNGNVHQSATSSNRNEEKFTSLMDNFDHPKEVLQKAMDLLNY